MATLHAAASQRNTTHALSPTGGQQAISAVDGLHCHLLLTLTIPDPSTVVSLEIRAVKQARALSACHLILTTLRLQRAVGLMPSACRRHQGAAANAPGSLTLYVSRGSIRLAGPSEVSPKSSFPATLRNSSTVELEIFVDGPATEVFANGGERALTSSANVLYIEGAALKATATHGAASIKATTWAMQKSVHVGR